jgi:hypothetical protein
VHPDDGALGLEDLRLEPLALLLLALPLLGDRPDVVVLVGVLVRRVPGIRPAPTPPDRQGEVNIS